MKTGIELIADERSAQKSREGFDEAHDDQHDMGELLHAAVSYLMHASIITAKKAVPPCFIPKFWPWAREWWKPSPDAVRNLVKAGALIAAEIDRLQRAKTRGN